MVELHNVYVHVHIVEDGENICTYVW